MDSLNKREGNRNWGKMGDMKPLTSKEEIPLYPPLSKGEGNNFRGKSLAKLNGCDANTAI